MPGNRGVSRSLWRAVAVVIAVCTCVLLAALVPTIARHLTSSPPQTTAAGSPAGATPVTTAAGTAPAAPTGTTTVRTGLAGESPAPGAVYSVDDYGAAGDGATDDSAAIQAAYTAAVAYAAGGSPATVAFTAGKTYLVSHAVILDAIRSSDYWDPGTDAPRAGSTVLRSGTVTFEGNGATIRYARSSSRYCWLQSPKPTVAGKTYGDLVIADFTIDHNDRAPSAVCGSVFWFQGAGNLDNVTITNVTTTANLKDHMDNGDGNNPNRNVCGVSITGAGYPAHDNYFTNIDISDCDVTAQSQSICITGDNRCVLDQLSVEDCTTNNLGFAGSSMMFGGPGMGWHVSVTGCDCSNSDDNGVEVDAFNEVTIQGCSFHRIRQAICLTRFSRPYKSTVPDIVIDDCHYSGDCGPYWQQGQANAGVRSPMMPEMRSNAGWIVPPNWGNVTIEDCTGQWNSYSKHCSFFTLNGPMNSVTIKDCAITDTGIMIQIGQQAGAGTLPITISGCLKRASTSASYVPLTQSDCSFSGPYTLSFTPASQ